MSVVPSVSVHSNAGTITGTLAAGQSSIAIPLGPGTLWTVTCTGDLYFKTGTAAVTVPDATSFPLWTRTYYLMLIGREDSSVRFYNGAAMLSSTYWLHPMVIK